MASPNRDLLTSFSPSLELFSISSGDGRIKIWDTLKGQMSINFTDITSIDGSDLRTQSEHGHLSLDYTCMKWLPSENKKKRKSEHSFIVLGTGDGDVFALDVAACQLKWKILDCHSGSVTAISFCRKSLSVYTAGNDGMVCQIQSTTGNLLSKCKLSTKGISSICISSDGKMLATAAGQLKVFDCSNNTKIQKFSGHPVAVRCMNFTEDGNYILSSAGGERYIVIWTISRKRKQRASCVLAMEHPVISIETKGTFIGDNAGLHVLALSEIGVCYLWYGKSIDELQRSKPAKISLSLETLPSNIKESNPAIFAATLHGNGNASSGNVLVAYGSLVKPSFEKILVKHEMDIKITSSGEGFLLPMDQSYTSKKGQSVQTKVTALNRGNAEDAILPIPKLFDLDDKRRAKEIKENMIRNNGEAVQMDDSEHGVKPEDHVIICIEDRLKAIGIIGDTDLTKENIPDLGFNRTSELKTLVEDGMPLKKMKSIISSMSQQDAYESIKKLIDMWKRSCSGKYALPWIYAILVKHGHYIISQDQSTQLLGDLCQMARCKTSACKSLLQLSGRLQLILAQSDKAGQMMNQPLSDEPKFAESDVEDEDVYEYIYGEEDDSSSSDTNM